MRMGMDVNDEGNIHELIARVEQMNRQRFGENAHENNNNNNDRDELIRRRIELENLPNRFIPRYDDDWDYVND